MTSYVVALSSLNLAGLRLLFTIGGCVGFAVVLFGLTLDRKTQASTQEDPSQTSGAGSNQEPPLEQPSPAEQIIYLSTEPVPTKSSEMSQQQKIAAALGRAGMTNPISSRALSSQPTTSQESRQSPTNPVTAAQHKSVPPRSAKNMRRMIFLAGSIIALLSLILLLTLR
jgi:hypothetical protein